MLRCPLCDFRMDEDRENLGSRCPSCKNPLYEPPNRLARTVKLGEPACAVHLNSESIGNCGRCRKTYCETCRCRWFNQLLCSACVKETILSGSDIFPLSEKKQFQQALWSLICGTFATILLISIFQVVFLAKSTDSKSEIALGMLLLILYPMLAVCSVFAIGLGSAAIRIGGRNITMAYFGLILGCLSSALWIGSMVWSIWIM